MNTAIHNTHINNSLKNIWYIGVTHLQVNLGGWVTHLFLSSPRLPPKNASAPLGCSGAGWLAIIIWRVRYIQYLLACQKLQRSMAYNMRGYPPSPSWEAGDCSHPPLMAHRVLMSKHHLYGWPKWTKSAKGSTYEKFHVRKHTRIKSFVYKTICVSKVPCIKWYVYQKFRV